MNEHFAYLEDAERNYTGRELCYCGATENHWGQLA